MNKEHMPFEEFSRRFDSIECSMTRELFERAMHKIEELRAVARSLDRRKDMRGCMALDDAGDEFVLMLEAFLRDFGSDNEQTEPTPNPDRN